MTEPLCRCCRAPYCYKAYLWCEPGPEHPRTGASAAEGRDLDELSKGRPVPGHLGACAVPACSHGWLWHERFGKHECTRPGCPCPGLVKHPVTPLHLMRMEPDALDSSQVAG